MRESPSGEESSGSALDGGLLAYDVVSNVFKEDEQVSRRYGDPGSYVFVRFNLCLVGDGGESSAGVDAEQV